MFFIASQTGELDFLMNFYKNSFFIKENKKKFVLTVAKIFWVQSKPSK